MDTVQIDHRWMERELGKCAVLITVFQLQKMQMHVVLVLFSFINCGFTVSYLFYFLLLCKCTYSDISLMFFPSHFFFLLSGFSTSHPAGSTTGQLITSVLMVFMNF